MLLALKRLGPNEHIIKHLWAARTCEYNPLVLLTCTPTKGLRGSLLSTRCFHNRVYEYEFAGHCEKLAGVILRITFESSQGVFATFFVWARDQ